MKIKKTLAFYSILFLVLLMVQRGAGVLTKIVLANSITPYEYGLIILIAVTIPSIFQLFSNLNFYQILSHSTRGKDFFGFSIIVSCALMFFISIFLILFSEPFFIYLNVPTENESLFIIVVLITMWSTGVLVDFQGLYTGLKQYSLPGLILTLPSIIRLIALVSLILTNIISLEIVLLVFALSNLVPLIYILAISRAAEIIQMIKNIKIPDKKILAFGTTIFMISSFSVIGQYLVKIVLSHELGLEWQGYFDVSLTLIAFIVFGLSTIGYVSVPEATSNEKTKLYQEGGLADIARMFFAFALIMTIVLYFYADFIVILLFSIDYLPAAEYAILLAIGSIFLIFLVFNASVNIAHAKTLKDYCVFLIPTLLFVPLFFILSQVFIRLLQAHQYGNGFLGAYLSYTGILIANTLITFYLTKDRQPVKSLFIKFERLVISLFITALAVVLLNPNPLLGIFLTLILFTLLIFSTGYLNKSIIMEIFEKHNA